MFEEFNGLPLHALAVHAPVVLVPLLVLAALAYALVPKTRRYVWWVAALLAVIAPLSVLFAKLSGDAFVALAFSPNPPEAVVEHRDHGTQLAWVTGALGVLTLGLVWAGQTAASGRSGAEPAVKRPESGNTARARSGGRTWLTVGLSALVVVAAAFSVYLVYQTGDTGAQMIWHNRLPS